MTSAGTHTIVLRASTASDKATYSGTNKNSSDWCPCLGTASVRVLPGTAGHIFVRGGGGGGSKIELSRRCKFEAKFYWRLPYRGVQGHAPPRNIFTDMSSKMAKNASKHVRRNA